MIEQPYGTAIPLNQANGWKHTWTNLPRYVGVNSNKEYSYVIKEVSNSINYATPVYTEEGIRREENNGKLVILPSTVITNIQKVNIPVEKIWEDSNDTSSRPSEIKVQLYRKLNKEKEYTPTASPTSNSSNSSGIQNSILFPDNSWTPISNEILLSEKNYWKYTWENLDLFEADAGKWYQYDYTVQELSSDWLKSDTNPNGKYEVSYNGDIKGFKIINKLQYDARVELDLTKQYTGLNPGEGGKFNFSVKEVAQQSDGTWAEIFGLSQISIFVKNETETIGNASEQEKIVIGYKNDDNPTLGLHYYEIRELKEINDQPATDSDSVIFDETYYRAEIAVAKDTNGKLSANLNKLTRVRNGKEEDLNSDKESSLLFINRKKANLVIKKIVDSDKVSPDKKFDFTITISGTDISLPEPDAGSSTLYHVNDDGTISFQLAANDSITIPIPVGSTVTIKEDEKSHAGYSVKFKVNDEAEVNTDMLTITDIASDGSTTVNVTCTNTPGAVLPDTGGPGLLMMNRLGWMLLLLALLMAGMEIQFYGERRNRKIAAIQRENSRGFDPDDY